MRKDDYVQNNIDLDLEDGYPFCSDSEEQDMDDAHKVFDELPQPLTLCYLVRSFKKLDEFVVQESKGADIRPNDTAKPTLAPLWLLDSGSLKNKINGGRLDVWA